MSVYLLLVGFILSEKEFHSTLIQFLEIYISNILVIGFDILKFRGALVILIADFIEILLSANWDFQLILDGQILTKSSVQGRLT